MALKDGDSGDGDSGNDTGEIVIEIPARDEIWAGPLLASLRGRRFFVRLFNEALRAVIERGDHGTRLHLDDQGGDRFELCAGERRIAFERNRTDARVLVSRQGFPADLVPLALEHEIIESPADAATVSELAAQQIKNGVRMLFRRRE